MRLFSIALLLLLSLSVSAQKSKAYRHKTDKKTLADSLPMAMPYNRLIDAAGTSIVYGDAKLENHTLDLTPLPGNKQVVIEDRYGIAILDRATQKITYRWSLNDAPATRSMMSTFSGIEAFVDKGKTYLVWGASERERGKSGVVIATFANGKISAVELLSFAPVAPSPISLPNDVAVSIEGGETFLYVVLNGNNQLVKVRFADRSTVWTAPTGVAPYGVALAGNRAFVTNWAGPVPIKSTDSTRNLVETAGVPWGSAYIDPRTGAMSQGSVSVIDIAQGNVDTEVSVGLHPNAIISTRDAKTLYVANGNSDYVSVIDAQTRQVTDSIAVGLFGRDNPYIGSTPNALALDSAGTTLYVANGLDNALAVVALGNSTAGSVSRVRPGAVRGYIPTQAYPAGMLCLGNELYVANLEGIGSRIATLVEKSSQGPGMKPDQKAFTSHRQLATLSVISVPTDAQLVGYTERVRKSSLQFRLALAELIPRPGAKPRPVPQRIGEPSVFKHVVYIIKENRTYDQVLGDMPEGRGMPSLCVFGDSVTPNQHQLSRDYLLLDNYYVSGKSSAEGHHWADAAMVTDYTEKSVRAWFRSYPHVLYDALVYNKKGLIWNNALDHGKTVRIYGEACTCEFDKKQYDWQKLYRARETGQPFSYTNTTTISRVRPILAMNFPGCDDETISDQMRADAFIRELTETAKRPGDTWPNLMVMSLPNDHTAGLSPAFPTPRAMVADNDLAVGRIVEAITKSRFADSTVIFITEDDSQAGWDHISAYRTTGYVISPYSRLKKTVSTNYNQTSVVRTIEQILGLPPMNVIDATALPLFDCFTDKPDPTPYTALPNRVRLDEMNKPLTGLRGRALQYARESAEQAEEGIDTGEDDLMNRILWFATRGNAPYPGKK